MTEPVSVAVPAPSSRLELLDYLRFGAAASVLCFHYFANGAREGRVQGIPLTPFAHVAQYGYLGVELFFLISGFVIFASVQGKSAQSFTVSRAVRLYPAFWVAVPLTATVTALWGDVSGLGVSAKEVIINLTMAPGVFNVDPVDGVYWTLLLELYFYLAVLVMLLLGLGPRLSGLLPVWIFGQLAVFLLADQYTRLPYLGDSFVLFATGALIADIRRVGLNAVRGVALTVGVFLSCAWTLETNDGYADRNGFTYSDVALVVILLGFVALVASMWSRRVSNLALPRSRAIGDLTYPLYLVHAFIGYIALTEAAKVMPPWAAYVLVITAVLTVAWLIHVFVEVKPRKFWRRFFTATVGRVAAVLTLRPNNWSDDEPGRRRASASEPFPGKQDAEQLDAR